MTTRQYPYMVTQCKDEHLKSDAMEAYDYGTEEEQRTALLACMEFTNNLKIESICKKRRELYEEYLGYFKKYHKNELCN